MTWWSAAKTKSLCLDIKLYLTAAAIHYCCYYLASTSCCCITQQYTWYVRRPKHCFVDVMLQHAVLASWKNIFLSFCFVKSDFFAFYCSKSRDDCMPLSECNSTTKGKFWSWGYCRIHSLAARNKGISSTWEHCSIWHWNEGIRRFMMV